MKESGVAEPIEPMEATDPLSDQDESMSEGDETDLSISQADDSALNTTLDDDTFNSTSNYDDDDDVE